MNFLPFKGKLFLNKEKSEVSRFLITLNFHVSVAISLKSPNFDVAEISCNKESCKFGVPKCRYGKITKFRLVLFKYQTIYLYKN